MKGLFHKLGCHSLTFSFNKSVVVDKENIPIGVVVIPPADRPNSDGLWPAGLRKNYKKFKKSSSTKLFWLFGHRK